MKTSELIGPALDWAVAKCEGRNTDKVDLWKGLELPDYGYAIFPYSTDWSQGGSIIEREKIGMAPLPTGNWHAGDMHGNYAIGPTPLIAAMRCYVSSRLGAAVEIPEELCK